MSELVAKVAHNSRVALNEERIRLGIEEMCRRAPEWGEIRALSAGALFKMNMDANAAAARAKMAAFVRLA